MGAVHPGAGALLELMRGELRAAAVTPRLIAVDGPSGSGKSTIARPLAGALSAPLIRIDDIVLEGVTCSRRAISDLVVCRIRVEAPSTQRLARGVEREGASHRALWKRWMVEERAFFEGARPAGRTRSTARTASPASRG